MPGSRRQSWCSNSPMRACSTCSATPAMRALRRSARGCRASSPRMRRRSTRCRRPAARLPGESVAAGATLAVLFTSGTSGRSKGACLSWGNFEASAVAALERLGPAVGRRWLSCMPLFHVGGLSILVRSVLFGGPVRLLPRFDVAAVSEALDRGRHRRRFAGADDAVAPARASCRPAGSRGPRGAAARRCGSSARIAGARADLGYPVFSTYGLTEATSQVATARPRDAATASPPPMLPLQGTEVRVVADDRDAAIGEPGEILVRGPTVMSGYLERRRRPPRTQSVTAGCTPATSGCWTRTAGFTCSTVATT